MVMERPVVQIYKPGEREPIVDPTRCYFCRSKVTAKCATCRVAVCDDHLREMHRCELFCEPITVVCPECAVLMRNW